MFGRSEDEIQAQITNLHSRVGKEPVARLEEEIEADVLDYTTNDSADLMIVLCRNNPPSMSANKRATAAVEKEFAKRLGLT